MALRHRLGHFGLLGLVGVCLGVTAGLCDVSGAWAHVTVHPNTLPAGSSDVELTFRVPNERDDANTVMLQVFFPTNLPLLTVDVLPVPAWTATVQTQNLSTPVQTDDGPVSQVVSEVTWKATAGGIGQGQYEDFDVAVGVVPDKAADLVFKALQTYSSGEIVRWIEVPIAGQPEPDTPAPVLTITGGSHKTSSAATAAPNAHGGSSTALTLGVVAVVLAGLNLCGVGFLLIRRRGVKSTA